MAGAGAGLLSASPDRPGQPMAEILGGPGEQRREQVLDLVAGQADQPGRWRGAGYGAWPRAPRGGRGRAWPGWSSGTSSTSDEPDADPGRPGPCRSGCALQSAKQNAPMNEGQVGQTPILGREGLLRLVEVVDRLRARARDEEGGSSWTTGEDPGPTVGGQGVLGGAAGGQPPAGGWVAGGAGRSGGGGPGAGRGDGRRQRRGPGR